MVFPLGQCPLPPKNITIENAQFVYQPNFEGREERFNKPGDRYFNVRIPDNIVDAVTADGWNIKWTKPAKTATPQQIEEHVSEPFLPVHIGFTYRPPSVSVWEDGKETFLDDETCGLIDQMQFETIDVVIRGRNWEDEGRQTCGIKAWLQTFVGVVETDDIQRKYARLREAE